MNLRIFKSVLTIASATVLGVGATFASFTSNTVTLTGTTITTGEAALKICDVSEQNKWNTTINPALHVQNLAPGEERDVLGTHKLYVGNDNGSLADNLGAECNSYGSDSAAHSVTAMKLLPNVAVASENCADGLASNLKLRFELKGVSTDAKTLNAWATNTTQTDQALAIDEAGQVKVFASLSSTTTAQNSNCSFAISFTGKQA